MTTHKIDKWRNQQFQENYSEFSSAVNELVSLYNDTEDCKRMMKNINNGQSREIIPFISSMKSVWQSIRVAIFDEIRKSYDKRIEEAEIYQKNLQRRLEHNIPVRPKYEDIKKIEILWQDMLLVKHMAGFSYSMKKVKSLEERLKNVMEG